MRTLDWLNRYAAFHVAEQVPTRVLRPHAAGHQFGDMAGAVGADNLLDRSITMAQQIEAALA